MRKQTKLVAVASAAALLAIGASMTSFAATGWVEESGEWFYYEKDGSKAEDVWKKSGDKWFWLDSEEGGAMAIDKLVDDNDNTYYVDSTGAMVANTWVKVVNEEQDDEDDPAEYNYYYMQSNGKAYKASNSTSETKFKTIDGKRYAFDEDGKMLYGWVNNEGSRVTDEDGWADEGVYYCGNWDDGAMKTGWQKIYVHDAIEDDDMDHWFWFKSNGKKFVDDDAKTDNFKTKKLNGKKYGFDDRGVMVYQWNVASNANMASASGWNYFNSPEDGARVTKGWFKVIAPDEDSTFTKDITDKDSFDASNASDEEEKWYYADGDGNLYTNAIKKIKGKYYAFGTNGAMLSGLVFIGVDSTDGTIYRVYDDGVDSDELDDIIDGESSNDNISAGLADSDAGLYYFGNDADADGAMKTGSVTVNLDGDSKNFMFKKSGGVESRGKGVTGIDDSKYIYKYGLKIKADSDDKYQVVYAVGDTGRDGSYVEKVDSRDLRTNAPGEAENKDHESVYYNGTMSKNYYLVNTSGAIQKSKTAAKDGNDWYFYLYDKQIRMYSSIKELKEATATYINEDGKEITVNLADAAKKGVYIPNAYEPVNEDVEEDVAE